MKINAESMDRLRDIASSYIASYGEHQQLAQLQEEAAELSVAASHYRRGRLDAERRLLEEAADVVFLLTQMDIILGPGRIWSAVERKFNLEVIKED